MGQEDVRVSIERVRSVPGASEHVLDAPRESGRLASERTLLDIHANGHHVLAPRLSHLDAERARRLRLWAERGEFRHVRASMFQPSSDADATSMDGSVRSALASLRAAYHAPEVQTTIQVSNQSAQERPARPGTIHESEFVPLRDTLIHQLEVSLFHAEQAQNLLGMLIQNTRTESASSSASSSVLAAQSDYFLDPHALSLSSLDRSWQTSSAAQGGAGVGINPAIDEDVANGGNIDDGDQAPPREKPSLSARKLVLQEKLSSLRSAAAILSQGAEEIQTCLPTERDRWHGLQRIQQRGWKLTPGRPLVDMERFDTTAKQDILHGFGVPILQGDGSVKEEGARDAWIGYGPSEAPIAVLQRTLAYWADAPQGAADTHKQHNRLAFPDRAWHRLQVQFHEQCTDGSSRVWVSAYSMNKNNACSEKEVTDMETDADPVLASDGQTDADVDLDAQLYEAQLDAVDTELFRELAAQSGTLSPVLSRSISEDCVRIPLSSSLTLCFVMVPFSRTDAPHCATANENDVPMKEVSPWANMLLHVLRLRMLRGWTVHLANMRLSRVTSIAQRPLVPRSLLMAPLWELYEYTLFLNRLRAALEKSLACFADACMVWQPFGTMHDARMWIASLLDLTTNEPTKSGTCGGNVWVYHRSAIVAQLALRAPSYIMAYFPQHPTPGGVGIRMPVELESLVPFLESELATADKAILANSASPAPAPAPGPT